MMEIKIDNQNQYTDHNDSILDTFGDDLTINGDLTVTGTSTIANLISDNTRNVSTKLASEVVTSVDSTLNATNLNTANTIVKRDGFGNFTASSITASLTGNADTSTNTSNVSTKTASEVVTSVDSTLNATDTNTISTIVKRDASGIFSCGGINIGDDENIYLGNSNELSLSYVSASSKSVIYSTSDLNLQSDLGTFLNIPPTYSFRVKLNTPGDTSNVYLDVTDGLTSIYNPTATTTSSVLAINSDVGGSEITQLSILANGDIIPKNTNTVNIGSSSAQFDNIYVKQINRSGGILKIATDIEVETDLAYSNGASNRRWYALYSSNISDNGSTVTLTNAAVTGSIGTVTHSELETSEALTSTATTSDVNNTLVLRNSTGDISVNELNLTSHLNILDSSFLNIGTSDDLQIYHNGVDSFVKNDTGHLNFDCSTSGKDIKFQLANSSSTSSFQVLDNSSVVIFDIYANGTTTIYRPTTSSSATLLDLRSDNTGFTGAGSKCKVLCDGDVLNDTNVYGQLSDRRLKSNIKDDTVNHLQNLKQIKVRKFERKNDINKKKMRGFIAQEMELLFPDLVGQINAQDESDKIGGLSDAKYVKTSLLTPILVSCIQELSKEIDSMKTRIAILEG